MQKNKAIEEFDLAWEEYFKNKPEPKNEEEEKQLEEFYHWYNNIRKQSDTGKTPAEMYKETYGEEPPKELIKTSRMMNFSWNDYEGSKNEEEIMEMSYEIFDSKIWKSAKNETKDLSKRELAKTMFGLGFVGYYKMINEDLKTLENNPRITKRIKEMIEELEKEEK